ncbi:phosphatase and actin regulator 2 [Trichonephila clavipes]|nr:phosphatase and actin regulator 2 [Trichonephila clavipes]
MGILRESYSDNLSPMERKHSRFTMLRRLFKPWKWKRKKKSDRFEQMSRTLERKISMRSTKEEINSQSVTYTSSSVLETYNTVVSLSVPSFLYVSDSPLVSMKKKKGISTAADSIQSGWPLWNSQLLESLAKHAVFARRRSESKQKLKLGTFEKRAEKD